jgi:DNA-binding transcriptional LysR family regulator
MIDASLFPALLSFLTVARTRSVAATARQQHRTSSAISQQLRRLESHFGVKLVERAGRGLRLTPAGDAALPVVAGLWSEAEAAFGGLAALSGQPATTVRVAVSDYLGKALLVPVLRALLAARVPVRFEIVTTHSRDAIARVARGDIEFGVVSAATVPAGLDAPRLFDQGFAWVGPSRPRIGPPGGRPLGRPGGRPVGRDSLVARLAHEPLLRLGAESHGRRLLDDFLERHRIRPVSTIDLTSVSLMLAYIASGIGIGLVPALAVADLPARRIAVEAADVPATPVRLMSRSSARRSPVAARFAEAVEAEGRRAAIRLSPRPASRATRQPRRSS